MYKNILWFHRQTLWSHWRLNVSFSLLRITSCLNFKFLCFLFSLQHRHFFTPLLPGRFHELTSKFSCLSVARLYFATEKVNCILGWGWVWFPNILLNFFIDVYQTLKIHYSFEFTGGMGDFHPSLLNIGPVQYPPPKWPPCQKGKKGKKEHKNKLDSKCHSQRIPKPISEQNLFSKFRSWR